MKRKIQKIFVAFAIFLSLPLSTYSRDCSCSQIGGLTGGGFEWKVRDGIGCCGQGALDGASDVFRLTAIRNADGSITTARTKDTIQNAIRGCC